MPSTSRLRPDASGQEIAVEFWRGAAPTLVFLHGMTSTRTGHKSEALLGRASARGLGFARFDFRGHGDSDGTLADVTISDLCADVAAVVDHVGECVLIGSSMGGLAAAFATGRILAAAASVGAGADIPPRRGIRALVLLSPALGYLPEMAREHGAYELRRADDTTTVLSEHVLDDARRYDESALPGQLHLPVLVVHGGADKMIPPSRSDALCRAIPHRDKEYWLVEGGSHSLNEDFAAILDRIEAFLDARSLICAPRPRCGG